MVSVVREAIAALLTVVLVGVFASFYVQAVVFSLFGRGFGEITGTWEYDPKEPSVEPLDSVDASGSE